MRKVLLVAAMMMASVATFAQNAVGQWTIQPKVGLNIADLQKVDNSKVRCGVAVGAEVEYGVSDIFGLSFGALYSMQGSKSDEGDLTLKADYINVPILANVYVAKGLAVKLGLQPGFNINNSVTASANGVTGTVDGNRLGLEAKTLDLSIPVGLSYQYENFVIDGRYNWGLTKVYDGDDAKNSVFQITVGYKFSL